MGRRWTPAEDAALLAVKLTPHTERFSGASALRQLGRQLGRSRVACSTRYERLQRKRGHVRGQWTQEGLWSEAEDRIFRRHLAPAGARVPHGTWGPVAEQLGRTPAACKTRAHKLRHQ